MKRVSGFLMAVLLLAACKTSDKKKNGEISPEDRRKDSLRMVEKQKAMEDTANYTTIQWLDSTFKNMGKVKEGDPVDVTFRFKNTGDHPLVIANVTAGCGCTVPEKPEEPIMPGAEGTIKAVFNSSGRKDLNKKDIFVDANTKPSRSHILSFQVVVE
ncbi:MAG: DUF1573 domain-containing protein [Chitinophagaceae bacterium]|nr:DUF1573 domain-containing protein [Chitinophagaceae bacterium]